MKKQQQKLTTEKKGRWSFPKTRRALRAYMCAFDQKTVVSIIIVVVDFDFKMSALLGVSVVNEMTVWKSSVRKIKFS